MPDAIASDGVRIHYERRGSTDAEPLLMVQGLGTDSRGWTMQLVPFSVKYHCLVPDNRGVGRSEKPAGPYDLEQMADDLVAVLDDAGVESAHVLGASMGGVMAQLLAVRHPERVRSLVLACTACRHEPWRRELLAEWADLARVQGMRVFLARNMRWVAGPRSLRRFWPVMRLLAPVAMNCPAPSFAAQVDAILAMDDRIRDRLTGVAVPALVVVGSQDILTPLADSEELAELVPGAELAVIPGAAHGFMFEHPATFNQVVTDFLDHVIAERAGGEDGSLAAVAADG